MNRRGFLVAGMCVAVVGDAQSAPSDIARLIDGYVNAVRRDAVIQQLRPAHRLTGAAARFADVLAAGNRLDHGADGRTLGQRARAEGYPYRRLAENLAQHSKGLNDDQLARQLVSLWLGSPGHRKNILDGGLLETGIGVSAGHGSIFAVQVFGLRA